MIEQIESVPVDKRHNCGHKHHATQATPCNHNKPKEEKPKKHYMSTNIDATSKKHNCNSGCSHGHNH